MKYTVARIVISVTLLLAGMMIYILFRQEVIFLDPVRALLPGQVDISGLFAADFIRYNLADGLWYGALLTMLSAVPRTDTPSRVVAMATASLPFVLEVLQWAGMVAGTFDPIDIVTYIFTLITFKLCVTLNSQKLSDSSCLS